MRPVRFFVLLLAVSCVTGVALLHYGQQLSWDEVEYFRATRWIAEGRAPYRDFWEHHLPLQWLTFAPVARLIDGPGASAVVALRWAQLPLWIGSFVLLYRLMAGMIGVAWARWCALALLVSSSTFALAALEYRVDTLGTLGFLAGVALAGRGGVSRGSWIAFGVVISGAVLANMRLAPLAVVFGLLVLFVRPAERRWGWNSGALWMVAGAALTAAPFIGWLVVSGSWAAFREGVIDYSLTSDRLVRGSAGTLAGVLTTPFRWRDVGGVALLLAAGAGIGDTWRDWRRPDLRHVLSILAVAALVLIATAAIHYHYHLQIVIVLAVPLAAYGLSRLAEAREPFWRVLAMLVAGVSTLLFAARTAAPGFGAGLAYQDAIMRETDRRTSPDARVWDGVGYALRREPAYRYWFLPAGVRAMAQRGLIEPYDAAQVIADPPAAIVYNERVHHWLVTFPALARHVVHHYVPLERNLWIPGMSSPLPPGSSRIVWSAPAAGRYDVWSSELLAKHPWFARPLLYGRIEGEDAALLEIPLPRLPRLPDASLQWTVDGVPAPAGTRTLVLRRDSRVELRANTSAPAGVLLVPGGLTSLCRSPVERFVF